MLEVPARPQFDEDVPADEDGNNFILEMRSMQNSKLIHITELIETT